MESMLENLNEASRFDHYQNYHNYGMGWPRANRGDNVTGCVKPGSYCSYFDVHNMSVKRVVPAVKEFQDKLSKLSDLTVLNDSGSAFRSEREDGTIYFKILEVPQEEIGSDPRLNLYNGFGAVYGPDQDSIVNDSAANHPYGRDMEILFQIPREMHSGSLRDFRRAGKSLDYDTIVRENPKVRDFLRNVLSEKSFDEFYGIGSQAEPVEIRSDAKKLVFAFWAIQKKVKATGLTDSVADPETIKKIRALLDTPEGRAAFGKYYDYARSFIYKNFPGIGVREALEILDECGMIYERE